MKKLHTFVNAKIVFRVGDELLTFRSRDGGHYLPGGHLEHGEHPLDALKRELMEEMGYKLTGEPEALGAWTSMNDAEGLHRITIVYLQDLPAKPDFQWLAADSHEAFEEFVWVHTKDIDALPSHQKFRRLLHRAADYPRAK